MENLIVVGKDLEEISQKAAGLLAEAIGKKLKEAFSLVLPGGSTPRRFFEILASPPYSSLLPWKNIHLFWGDERAVPPDHPQSNFGEADRLFISKISIPRDNIHRIKGELDPPQAAAEYEKELRRFFKNGDTSIFDFVLLGLGSNGHTASLFPETAVLNESKKWVVGYFIEEIQMSRITLTAPVLNRARSVVFLVSGKEKAGIVKRVIQGPRLPRKLPAQLIRPENGTLTWLLDRPAARLLD